MARQTRDDSLLLKSAKSLGRIIGSLQRQLDGATRERKTGAADSGKRAKTKTASAKGLARKAARPR